MWTKTILIAIGVFLFAAGTTEAATFQKTLQITDQNEEVRELQKILKSEGLFCSRCAITGYFGYWTRVAVKNFQKKYGIRATGLVGPLTRAKLNQLAQPAAPAATPPPPTPTQPPPPPPPPPPPASTSVVQDTTSPTFSIIINGGATSANNQEVIIQVSCKDPSGGEAVRFSNLSSFSLEQWEGAAAGKRWTLSSGDGLKTVYAQCKDEKGNIANASDTITLDASPPLRSDGKPTGTLAAGTAQVTLLLTTNESATCRYSATKGIAYDSMRKEDEMSSSPATSHSIIIAPSSGGGQSYAIRCKDASGNANPDDYLITFSIGATNPTLFDIYEGSSKNTSYTIPILTIKYFPKEPYSALWEKTIQITNDLKTAIEQASRKSLTYEVKGAKRFEKTFPGYEAMLKEIDICTYIEQQGVKEVWLFTNEIQPPRDLIPCAKTYSVYAFDYDEDSLKAFETWSRQFEKELETVDAILFRELFQGPSYPQAQKVIGRCGSPLNPPNATREGDRSNKNGWYSDCLDWNPDSIGTISFVDCSLWNCDPFQYMMWNWQQMPGQNNTKTYKGKQLRNWWDVHGDFDNVMTNSRRLTLE